MTSSRGRFGRLGSDRRGAGSGPDSFTTCVPLLPVPPPDSSPPDDAAAHQPADRDAVRPTETGSVGLREGMYPHARHHHRPACAHDLQLRRGRSDPPPEVHCDAAGTFRCKLRLVDGRHPGLRRRWPLCTARGRWVHGVLLHLGPLGRVSAIEVRFPEGTVQRQVRPTSRTGRDAVALVLRLDDDALVELSRTVDSQFADRRTVPRGRHRPFDLAPVGPYQAARAAAQPRTTSRTELTASGADDGD